MLMRSALVKSVSHVNPANDVNTKAPPLQHILFGSAMVLPLRDSQFPLTAEVSPDSRPQEIESPNYLVSHSTQTVTVPALTPELSLNTR